MREKRGRKNRTLSADDVDELIEMLEVSEDQRVRRFWQTLRDEKLRGGTVANGSPKHRRFLSIPLYHNSIAVIFILALLSFVTWFLFNYTSISLPVDLTQPALVIAFAFSAIMFHRYVSDKEEIVSVLDELAGYSIQNESIFENIGNALIVVDAAGKVTKVNRKSVEILETESRDVIGKNCQHIFTNNELADLLIQTLRTGHHVINHEIELESSSGRSYSLQVTTSVLQNKKGYTIGAVEVINDVTEIRELQEKLKLNEHLASIGELSAKLGHEIGNSLGGIKLFTDNLLEELDHEDHRREYAEEILSEVHRLKTRVAQLKDYSRPVSLDLKNVNMNDLMNEAISFAGDKIQENNISIKRHLTQDLPDVMIDPDHVRGALLNVIINAIQAMPEGGELSVSTQQRNNHLEIAVSDTGSGISEEIRSRIFNPFFTTKKMLGTGLGLSIVYKAIQAHGGTVKFDSEVNRGTTFTIGLPIETTMEM